jgi:tripartite-type tricarboxylate transporter receptor subunit TctC
MLFAFTCVPPAQAQNYPVKPIRIIVPFAPAGPTDMNARMVAQRLTEAWGQSVIVDNRTGAGGTIGTDLVAKAPPDGYTLLGANPGPLTIAPSLYAKLPYDPSRSFAPVTLVTGTTSVLATHPGVPAKTIRELIAIAKARPGDLTYGTPGVGTVGHLTWELFNHMAGTSMTHVPYKGTALANNDMLAGHIDLRTLSIPVALPLAGAGKIRVLGVNGKKRSAMMPAVPTVDESGLKGFEANNWNGIMAPAGTPREIVTRLHDEIMRRVLAGEQRERLIREGYDIEGLGPDEFAAYVAAETVKWAKVVKAANIKVQ